ncbi:MAG: hypothetical protein COW85_05925 [Ignavibacteria bacterium CG22_combo_CG10-13_8_21_14_all_37_15]|nr:hypothetical protein [Ignavibacteria bacterium]NCS87334.1 hypothetical protein [Ignavibacteria bacterium]OIO14584.1 MAG: hypothetical protein AUJ54_13960 [Ignavibacteria bacterium CG1_02_37_35]PIP78028.1 MAG: hypothetical protein COW85_05925 [Ignavibacteria bacterium CG22_combo_CG10-13_8_21_14_all_37_15]PJC59006.1 MAG: hypothetical protein CO025_07545 [Ignavibacteria bacterium CG_4_9_14_0_2_um_filter_37_13]
MSILDIRKELSSKINKLEGITKNLKLQLNDYGFLTRIINKTTFDIAVVGEFTSGKSTLINALLGIDLLPTLLEPTTARITYISYSENAQIILIMKNGIRKVHPFDSSFLKSLIAENKPLVNEIDYIEVLIDIPLLKNSIRIIDTPGTNDTDEQRVAVTYGLLPEADAVVYVTIHPVTSSNVEVYKEHILGNKIKNIFFVLNKIDLLGDNLELAAKDVSNWFRKNSTDEINTFYTVSAIDYLEGTLEQDEKLVTMSKFKIFADALIKFIESSEKFDNLKIQYEAVFQKIKLQIVEIIKLKAGGLSIPEESFQQRKDDLKNDLKLFREQTRELENQVELDFDSLTYKVEESLNTLLNDILVIVNEILSSDKRDVNLLIKDLEMEIKFKYENWRERNEPLIEKILRSIHEEISIRVMKSIQEVNVSLVKFTGTSLTSYAQQNTQTPLDSIMSDDMKSATASTVAVVGGMLILSTFGLFTPLAFLLGPLFQNFRKKRLQQQREQMKPQIISSLQENFQSFRREMIKNINVQKDLMEKQIDEALTAQNEEINKQIAEIEKERQEQTSVIEQKINEYKAAVENIGKI